MEPENNTSSNIKKTISIPAAIIVAGVLIAGAVYFSKIGTTAPTSAPTTSPTLTQTQQAPGATQAININNVKTTGEPFIGNVNAPVVIAYWSDYQCPFCKQNEETVMPEVITNYVDTGKVKIVFKDYQFLGPDSVTAALFSRAVWNVAPDKFYLWHKGLYDNQGPEDSGWASQSNIIALSNKILGTGLTAQIQKNLEVNQATYQTEIDADKAEGVSFGIEGTPSFLIGTQVLDGAQTYQQIVDALTPVLNSK